MPNITVFKYSPRDALSTLDGLSQLSFFQAHPSALRRKVSTVYVASASTLVHLLLQWSLPDRVVFTGELNRYATRYGQEPSALGLESIFFTLASDPLMRRILLGEAPLHTWLAANTDPSDRSAGAAFIDLAHPDRGAVFGPAKVSAMLGGGPLYDRLVANPDTFVDALFENADALIHHPGTDVVEIVGRLSLRPDLRTGGNEAAGEESPGKSRRELQRPAVGGPASSVDPGAWSRGTWGKAFKALGLICATGALISTGVGAPAGLWALNAALFAADAAILDFADGILASPSLTTQNREVPNMPLDLAGIVIVEEGSVAGFRIDEGPDATPPQPP